MTGERFLEVADLSETGHNKVHGAVTTAPTLVTSSLPRSPVVCVEDSGKLGSEHSGSIHFTFIHIVPNHNNNLKVLYIVR